MVWSSQPVRDDGAREHRKDDQRHTGNQKRGVAFWRKNVAFHGSDHERETDANGKCDRHARRVDADHQENIRNVEEDTAEDRPPDRAVRRAAEVFEKRHSGGAGIAKREREQDGECEHTDRVVPIEELKRPAILTGQFLRVCPRTPTQHRDDAKEYGDTKIVNDKHGESFPFVPNSHLDHHAPLIRFRTVLVYHLGRIMRSLAFTARIHGGVIRESATSSVPKGQPQKLTMEAKPMGSRLAPPTRTPSISGCAIRLFTLSGFTLPPYRMRTAAAASLP
jgi:hypothetical protein